MKIILTQDHKTLGRKGAIVDVKEGFARNILLSQNIAIAASPAAVARNEKAAAAKTADAEHKKEQSAGVYAKINGANLTIAAKAEDEKLFGAVSERDIAQELTKEYNFPIEAGMIALEKPIKKTGTHAVTVTIDKKAATVMLTVVAPKAP